MSPTGPEDAPISLTPDDKPASGKGGSAEIEEPISLVESSGESQVRMSKRFADRAGAKIDYRRALNLTGAGAIRCRVFHSKVSDAALEMMQDQINAWLDRDQIEIKQVCQTMGIMKGKVDEENVIITVWY